MIRLPWTPRSAPHLVLEINRRCNISCPGCYRRVNGTDRDLDAIERDLDTALEQRRAQTVSIAGGEPTLHPGLCDVVRMIRDRGLRAALLTNGLVLDDVYLERLRAAGLDVVMFHIDEGQQRPDLAPGSSWEELSALRTRMTQQAAQHGLDAGLSVTIHPGSLHRVPDLVRFMVDSPHINFLFASSYFDPAELLEVSRGRRDSPDAEAAGERAVPCRSRRTTNRDIAALLKETLDLEPFAYLPAAWSDENGETPMSWMSYFLPVLHAREGNRSLKMRAAASDAVLLRVSRLLAGRYLFYFGPNGLAVGIQIVLNAITTARLSPCVKFLAGLRGADARLGCKRMLFDNGPVVRADGRIACGVICPNATVRSGKLQPLCMADEPG